MGSGRPDDGGEGKIRGRVFRFRARHQASSVAASTLYDYALALVRADRFDDAQNEAEMAVRADASLVEAHELLGGLHARKKELPEAAREYAAALALKPDLARAQLRLGDGACGGGR